jgi:GT2 family glycosyltransferase
MKISVIIPTYNSITTLLPCIKSITQQTFRPSEILVIDNASTDKTVEKLKLLSKNKTIKVYENNTNLGVTGGRNRGIKEADKSSEYFLFFDHDMVADKNMIKELIKVAELAKENGIVTPKIYFWKDKKRIWAAGTGINLWTGRILFRGGIDTGFYDRNEGVQVAPAAILVKKEVLKKIKGFDNKYFATYEDTDFCFRAKREGYLTYYAPKAIAWHKIAIDQKGDAEKLLGRSYFIAKNKILFMKDFGKPTFWLFIPVFMAYYLKMSIKYRNINAFLKYVRGTWDGINRQ